MLPLYTNRALACIKLEEMQQAIDDCSRVIEYCEVFHDGYDREKALCFKAFMRRGLALKHTRDFKLAKEDFEKAQSIAESDKDRADTEKWIRLTEEDRIHQEKLAKIMANAESLKGKAYIDYLIKFLKGEKNEENEPPRANQKRKILCENEITKEELKKLTDTLSDDDMVYYFNISGGMKILVDSLYISTIALKLINKLLGNKNNYKLLDDFQRDHQFEALIDFMYDANLEAEGKTLSQDDMLIILQILETGSMNEQVRGNLSDKKKIKDLFLVVVSSIDVAKNKLLCSSLVQFISNLCHGTGKLRQMLAREESSKFFATLRRVLDQANNKVTYDEMVKRADDVTQADDEPNVDDQINQAVEEIKRKEFEKKDKHDRSVLRGCLFALLGNLCLDKTLRVQFAEDYQNILTQVATDFRNDVKNETFDWVEMCYRQLAFLVNVSVEPAGKSTLFKFGFLKEAEEILKKCKSTDEKERGIIDRMLNLLSKLLRLPEAAFAASEMRHLVFKIVLYTSSQYKGEIQDNAFRCVHPIFKSEDFGQRAITELNLTKAVFDNCTKDVAAIIENALSDKSNPDWNKFINACACSTALINAFPYRSVEFKHLIPNIIWVVKEKTEMVRTNAAVLLAALAKDESLKDEIRKHHGLDVLLSLRGAFGMKQ